MANSYLVGITLQASDQASAVIAAVRAPLAGLQVGLKAAGDSAKTFDDRWGAVAATGTRVGTVLAGMGAAVVGALGMAAKSAMAYSGQLYEASQRTNLSVENLTALRFAAEQSGMAAETLEVIFSRQARSAAAAAAGTGAAAAAYKKIGVSVTDANGNLRDNHELMLDTAEGLKNTTNATERMSIAITLFGRGAKQMLPLLMEGRAGIEKLEEKAKELGLTLDTETAKKMDDLADNVEASTASMAMSWRRVGGTILPVLAKIMEAGASGFRWLTSSPIGQILGGLGAAAVIAAGGVGVLMVAGIKLSQAYFAAQAAMLAFGETAVGMKVATWALGLVTAAGATNVWTIALVIARGAITALWTAMGPVGWVILALSAVGAVIWGLGSRHKNAEKAAKDQGDALKQTGKDGVDAESDIADETDKAAEAATKAKDAVVALADAQKESARAAEDQPRAVRDAAVEVRNAAESQASAYEAIGTQAEDSAEKVADAEKKVGDAHKEAAKQATDSARDIEDAEQKVTDAVEAAADKTEDAADRQDKAYQKVQKSVEDLDTAKLKGAEKVADVETKAADRSAKAQKALQSALNKQQGIEETPEEKSAREVSEAQAEVVKAQQEGEKAIAEAKVAAAEEVAKAEVDLRTAREEAQKASADLDKVITEGERQIADSERALADARVTAADAETKAAERVNEAEKALGKAREEQDKGREDALKRYRDAQEAYNKAVESAARKLEDAADRVVKAAASLEKAQAAEKKATAEVAPAEAKAQTQRAEVSAAETKKTRNDEIMRKHLASGDMYTPAMASGGPVSAGRAYVIGENGPEVFVPRMGGMIIPNSGPPNMGGYGGGGKTVVQYFTFNGPMYGDQGIRDVAKDEIGKAGRAMAYSQ